MFPLPLLCLRRIPSLALFCLLAGLGMLPGSSAAQTPVRLFDGASLKGWSILGIGSWTVQNGEIVAKQNPSNLHFTHLVHDTVLKDFRATFLFRTVKGNAGFFFRLQKVPANPDSLSGVQAVIDPLLAADDGFGLYETNGREWMRKWDYARHQKQYSGGVGCMMKWDWPKLSATSGLPDSNCRKTLLNPGGWNRLSVWAKGPRMIVKLNMRTIADTSDAALDKPGRFAFKLHQGQDVEVHFKDVEVSPWPDMPAGLRSRLQKAILYKGEAGVSPPPLREFVREIGADNGFTLTDGTEADFNRQNLAQYQAALFLSDYNINFNAAQRADFETWFKSGKGAGCMHACTRQEVSIAWPWWGDASGSKLADHTSFKERAVAMAAESQALPLWKGLDPSTYKWRDEWFHWVDNPRGKKGVTVLLDYADAGAPEDQAPKGLPHAWLDVAQGGRFFAWGAMHTMNALELPFTYDFLLAALREMGGYDTVGTRIDPRALAVAPATEWRNGVLRISAGTDFSAEVRDARGRGLFHGKGAPSSPIEFRPGRGAGILLLILRSGGGTTTRLLAPVAP